MSFLVWAFDNHPGKLIGTSVGFFLGLLMVTLGFWRTLVLSLFAILGFVLGKSKMIIRIYSLVRKNFKQILGGISLESKISP